MDCLASNANPRLASVFKVRKRCVSEVVWGRVAFRLSKKGFCPIVEKLRKSKVSNMIVLSGIYESTLSWYQRDKIVKCP